MQTIFVAGSGRSGTTWLGNIIAGDEFRIIFEPFDYRHVSEAERLGLRPYFRPNEDYPQWYSFVEKVVTGNLHNAWVDQERERLNPLKEQKGIVIKEIRANGMLAWIDNNFPCRIIYIIRHPCAVIASRMKLKWETHIDAFLTQPFLMEDYLHKYEKIMAKSPTDVQKHAIMWCIENLIPLTQMANHQWIFCKYEDIVMNTEAEVQRILNLLTLEYSDERRKMLDEPARTSWSKKPHNKSLLSEWKTYLSKKDIDDVSAILQAFQIKIYSTTATIPLT